MEGKTNARGPGEGIQDKGSGGSWERERGVCGRLAGEGMEGGFVRRGGSWSDREGTRKGR